MRVILKWWFLTRGHLPSLMACSTRRRTGTTAMVTTGASTVRGAMDSDLQVGIYYCVLNGTDYFLLIASDKHPHMIWLGKYKELCLIINYCKYI